MRPTPYVKGAWHVLSYAGTTPRHQHLWLCRCQCGIERIVMEYNLTSGRSMCCRKCSAAQVGKRMATHSMTTSVAYRRWQAMKQRCTNPRNKNWKYYGGAGIRVADEWLNDFSTFYAHVGDPPTEFHTIDRVDPFGHYEPGNVRWATQAEQMANTRRAKAYMQNHEREK